MAKTAAELSALLTSMKTPIFLAQSEAQDGGQLLTLHCAAPALSEDIARKAQKILGESGAAVTCRVKRHSARSLLRPKSLEELTGRFEGGDIIFDPTRAVNRAAGLVGLAKSIRAPFASKIKAIGFEARHRTVFVTLDAQTQDRSPAALRDLMAKVAKAVEIWRGQASPDFDLSVRVGFDAPAGARLVAVDAKSAMIDATGMLSAKFRRLAHVLGVAALFGAGTAAVNYAGEPAVSQPNMTIIKGIGMTDGDLAGEIYAKAAVPIGETLGAQIEGGIGLDDYYGVAGHLFARDPDLALLGGYASYESADKMEVSRLAAETELYVNAVTLGGEVGYQSGDVEHGVFGRVDVRFYATPDLVLGIGGETAPGIDLGRASIEWRPAFESLPGLSVFADGELGTGDYHAVRVGLSYHFGSSASALIDRDRKEDPGARLGNAGPVHAARSSGYAKPTP